VAGKLDPVAAEHAAGGDQQMADADADPRAGRPVVSPGTPHPVLSSLDEARPQAGTRREHRSKTSFHPNCVHRSTFIEQHG
jgi:hypothetical protein